MKYLLLSFFLGFTFLHAQELQFEVGDKAPNFEAIDQNGNTINLDKKLGHGDVVLVFYRGAWCPYCQKHMSELQASIAAIEEKGAKVIAITPEVDFSRDKMIEHAEAEFPIISDNDYSIMNAYGTSFTLSTETVPKYFNIVVKKTRNATANEEDVLPVPATFIIGQDGTFKYIHYDTDYTQRSSVEDILNNL